MNKKILPHIALFSVALIFAANYTIARDVMQAGYVEPLGFIVMRVVTGATLFWIISLFSPQERIAREDMLRLFCCGLFGIALNQMLFFSGLKFTTPINASLIMTTTPLLVLIISAIVLGERITKSKAIGMLIGLLGAVVVVGYKQSVNFNLDSLKGDIMVFANAVSYGIYLVIVKPLMAKYNVFTLLKWIFTIGLMIVLPMGFSDLQVVDWGAFTTEAWLGVAYVLIFTTCLAYLLNVYALRSLPPSVVGIYIFLQPILAALIAVMLGKESLEVVKIVSAVLIFTGVYLVSKQPAVKE